MQSSVFSNAAPFTLRLHDVQYLSLKAPDKQSLMHFLSSASVGKFVHGYWCYFVTLSSYLYRMAATSHNLCYYRRAPLTPDCVVYCTFIFLYVNHYVYPLTSTNMLKLHYISIDLRLFVFVKPCPPFLFSSMYVHLVYKRMKYFHVCAFPLKINMGAKFLWATLFADRSFLIL